MTDSCCLIVAYRLCEPGPLQTSAMAPPGERLRDLFNGLVDYSNAKIIEIATFILSQSDDPKSRWARLEIYMFDGAHPAVKTCFSRHSLSFARCIFDSLCCRNECMRTYCNAVEAAIRVSDPSRCLALFYVANEVLQVAFAPFSCGHSCFCRADHFVMHPRCILIASCACFVDR